MPQHTNAARKKRRVVPNTVTPLSGAVEPSLPPSVKQGAGFFRPEPATSVLSEFGRGVESGTEAVEGLAQGFAGAAAGALGFEGEAQERLVRAEERQAAQQINPPRIERVQDVHNIKDAADFVAGIAGKQGVIFAPVIGAAAAGAVASPLLPVSAGVAAATGAVGAGIGLETGDAFTNIVGDPESVENLGIQGASLLSLGTGALAGSLEAVPALAGLKRVGLLKPFQRAVKGNLITRFGTGAASQSAIEGATEGAQTIIQRTAAKFANENRHILGDEGIDELLNSIVSGAIFGAGVGGITGAASGLLSDPGTVDDQVNLEEALDEIDAVGGRSTDIEAEIDRLGEDGQFIRDARARSAESRVFDEPEELIGELTQLSLQEGGVRDRKVMDTLLAAVRELENPVSQLPGILADAGVSVDQVDLATAGLIERSNVQEEEFLQDIADQRGQKIQDFIDAPRTDPDTDEAINTGYSELYITRRHILRNKNGKLGFVGPTKPGQQNALNDMVASLDKDFPDLTFTSVGLGDALFSELDNQVQGDKEESTRIMLEIATEKLEEGPLADVVTELDPANPRAFLNQWKAIEREEISASLTGRDELRLTDTDIRGIGISAVVTPAKEGTRGKPGEERKAVKRPSVAVIQKKPRAIVRKGKPAGAFDFVVGVPVQKIIPGKLTKDGEVLLSEAQEELENVQRSIDEVESFRDPLQGVKRTEDEISDFNALTEQARSLDAQLAGIQKRIAKLSKGTATKEVIENQTVDAIALTNRMLTKLGHEGPRTPAVVGDAFLNGLAALGQRGINVDINLIPKDTVISSFKGKDITFGEAMLTGRARIQARIDSFRGELRQLKDRIVVIQRDLSRDDIEPDTKRKMKFIQRKMKRRIDKIPKEAAGLRDALAAIAGRVGVLESNIQTAQEELVWNAEAREHEFLAGVAVDIADVVDELERAGFHTLGVEQFLKVGRDMDEILEIARDERSRLREAKAPEGSREAGFAPEADPGPQTPQEIMDSWELRKQNAESTSLARATGRDLQSKVVEVVQSKADTILKALGLGKKVRVLTGIAGLDWLRTHGNLFDLKRMRDGELMGKVYAPEARGAVRVAIINPYITNEKFALETLAHEIGHAVLWELLDPKSEAMVAIQAEYEKWLLAVAALGPDTSASAIRASRGGMAYARHTLATVIGEEPILFSSLTETQKTYVLSFEEWFADQVAKFFVKQPTPSAGIRGLQGVFKKIADSVQEAYETIIKVIGFKPARSVSKFLNQIMKSNEEVEITVMSEEFGKILKAAGLDSDTAAVAGVMQTLAPFSNSTPYLLRKAFLQVLKPEERSTLYRFFNRASTKRRLKDLVGDPTQAELIESNPLHAAVFGYQMWIAGKFEIKSLGRRILQDKAGISQEDVAGPVSQFVLDFFTKMFDRLSSVFGVVHEDQQAEQILIAIREGYIDQRKLGQQRWSVVDQVRDTVLQRVGATFNTAFQHLKPFYERALMVADQRMLASGIPGLMKIARGYHAAVGEENQPETFFEARQAKIGLFMTSYTRLTAELRTDSDLKADVLAAMRNPSKANKDPEVQRITAALFKFNRRFRNYLVAAGVEVGDRGPRYFPWVWDPRKVQDNTDFINGLLMDSRFDKPVNNWLERRNEEIRQSNLDKTIQGGEAKFALEEEITREQLVDEVVLGLQQNEGYTDTELNPRQTGTTPWFASMHVRALAFLTEEGKLTKAEREQFDSLFSDQMDLTMMTYIRQGVKRAEYARRFGTRSEKLQQFIAEARAEGASEEQMRAGFLYIDAMNGVIGESTNQRVSSLLKLGARQGEIINPHWRTFTSLMMVIQNLAVLPLATLTSLVDPVGIMVRSQDMTATMAAMRAGGKEIANSIKNLTQGDDKAARSELRKLAEGMGTIEDHMTNEALEWEYGSTYLTPRLKAVNEFFFRAVGLTQWTRLTRIMALAGGKEFIKRHVQRPNKNSDRFLRQLNITAADVKFDSDGSLLILTRMQRETPDGGIGDAELARDDRVRNALNRFVNESILRPNAAQRPIWASDPNYALIFHLKSFMFSFHDRILRRTFQEAALGNVVPLVLLSAFIPAMLFADILRDMIQFGLGGNPRKAHWGLEDHIWNATQRSGLNGIGQLLVDAKEDIQFGGFGYESLAGPTVDGITDLDGLFSDDDETKWRAFNRNLPGNSAWKHWIDNGLGDEQPDFQDQ